MNKLKQKYPGRVPLICKTKGFEMIKNKFLVPEDLTIGQFLHIIRKRISLKPEQALYLLADNELPPITKMVKELKNTEVTLCIESAFG